MQSTLAIVATTLFALAACVGRHGPESVVRRFVDAVNRHDVDAALALLAPDFEFRDVAGTFAIPRAAAPALLGWDAAVDARTEMTVIDVTQNRVQARLVERNDFLSALGVEELVHRVRYVVGDGRIRTIVLLEAGEVAARTAAALEPLLAWAHRERPDRLAPLLNGGNPVYTGRTAPEWMALLADAHAAGVLEP